ncbi:MAG: recombinase family protein [Patescibacteria group bacterium]
MKKAVLYARVSSSLQEKERTIESQVDELKKQIKKVGNILVKEYVDDGYSGAMLSRPGMDKLREDIKTNKFDSIYFHNADRIARDVTYQNIIIGEILRHKKQIIINGEDYIHNPENKFTLTVLGAVAELEKTKILERSMRGRQYRLKQGQLLSHGCNIYGYNYIPKSDKSFPSYEINPKEAKVVNYIFKLYAQGNISFREIVKKIKEKNIPPRRGRKWTWYHIRIMLDNETYTGIRYFNTTTDTNALNRLEGRSKTIRRVPTDRSTWIGIKIPQIIDKDLFDKVQSKIKYNLECYRNAKNTQPLSNIVFCGVCHKRCFAYHRCYKVYRKKETKIYQRTIYKCGGSLYKAHNREINSKILEPQIFKMIEKYVFDPDKLKNCMDYFSKSNAVNQAKVEKEIKQIKTQIKSIQKQKQRIVDLYSLGDLERETYVEKVNGYDKNIQSLEKTNKELAQSMPVFNNPQEIGNSVLSYSNHAKADFSKLKTKDFLQRYVSKIEYIHNKGVDEIKLYGFVTIKNTKLAFVITNKINRLQALKKLQRQDKKDGLLDNKQITNKEYNKLSYEKSSTIRPS